MAAPVFFKILGNIHDALRADNCLKPANPTWISFTFNRLALRKRFHCACFVIKLRANVSPLFHSDIFIAKQGSLVIASRLFAIFQGTGS